MYIVLQHKADISKEENIQRPVLVTLPLVLAR